MAEFNYTCSKCGGHHSTGVVATVEVSGNPELRESIRSGAFFVRECPDCGARNLVVHPFIYKDSEQKVILCLTTEPISASGEIPGYTARIAGSVGELMEKIKIFDAGLDDIAVEMCKFVAAREIGKDVALKFVGIEGADNVITLTYPENGEMQMLEIGFNVYEDCAGILSRNPGISEKAKGLVRVDQAWLSEFFG